MRFWIMEVIELQYMISTISVVWSLTWAQL